MVGIGRGCLWGEANVVACLPPHKAGGAVAVLAGKSPVPVSKLERRRSHPKSLLSLSCAERIVFIGLSDEA